MAAAWESAPLLDDAPAAKAGWASAPVVGGAKPKNADFQQGRSEAGGVARGLMSVVQGPTMGFGDEILGAIGGAYDTAVKGGSFGDNYRANRDYVRGAQSVEQENNPIFSAVTQGMASAPTLLAAPTRLLGIAPAAAKAGVLANTGRAAAAGAGYGAVGGAGNSTAETLGGVALDAGKGAATGAAVGGVLTPVQAAMGAGGRNVMARLSDTSAAAFAREKLAEAFARDARGNLFTSGQANPLTQSAARLGKLGDEAVLADAGGKNTNQLLDTLATLPGRTKDSVVHVQRQRTAGVADRMRTAADDALGTNGQRLTATVDDLVRTREAAAGPIYERLRQVNLTPSQELSSIVQAADELGALRVARDIATANRQPFTIDTARQAGSGLTNTAAPPQWNAGQIDLIKQGLDQMLQSSKAIGKDGRLTPFGHSLQRLNTALKGEMDTLTFDQRTGESLYAAARNAYAGPSALIDAANAGRMAVTRDEATINGMLQGMGQSEMEAFRVGAFEALRGKLGTQGGQTQILNMWKEPTTREKLQAIFGDERSFREFASAAARENTMKRIQSVGTGSQTAARQAGMGDLDMNALTDIGAAVGNAKTGNVLGALGSARNAWNRVATPERVRDQMGQMLLSRGPEARQNLNALESLIQTINQQNALRADGTALIGSQIGNRLAVPLNVGGQ